MDSKKYEELTMVKLENEIVKLQKEKSKLKELGTRYLNKIKEGGKFGYPDFYDCCGESYFPCELLEVVDEERFIIKIREISINKVDITDVFGLTVVGV
jgi:hypothetical protein